MFPRCSIDVLLFPNSRVTINHILSGTFKGYGFACFNSKVAALQARHVLDGQEVDGHLVECGWLKEGSHKLSDLHSKVSEISFYTGLIFPLHKSHIQEMNKDAMIANLHFIFIEINYILRD